MHIQLVNQLNTKHQPDCLVLPISSTGEFSSNVKSIDKQLHGKLSKLVKSKDFKATPGQTLVLFNEENAPSGRLLLVGTGDTKEISDKVFKEIAKKAYATLLELPIETVTSLLHEVSIKDHNKTWAIQQTILLLNHALFRFEDFKSEKKEPSTIKQLNILFTSQNDKQVKTLKTLIAQTNILSNNISYLKTLAQTPANVCTPTFLAKEAEKIAKAHTSISIEVLNGAQIEKLGMGAFHAVSRGSNQDGRIVVLSYRGGKKSQQPIALVGKGITFDTGGNSMKDSNGMLDMKFDMTGAATVLAAIKMCAELKLPLNVVGTIAAAENMVSGDATRPSDIVKTLSGKTVEIVNTDAEGRLVLCDAMTYTQQQYKPSKLVTIATLTGAAMIALGYETTALISNDDELSNQITKAGESIGDRAWRLPLFEEYYDYLKSENADIVNANLNRMAGTITAGCFLSYFAKDLPWAHLDIAGSSVLPGRQTKSSGRPLPLIFDFLLKQA